MRTCDSSERQIPLVGRHYNDETLATVTDSYATLTLIADHIPNGDFPHPKPQR